MKTSVSATGRETEPAPAPHPRAAWAAFLREVCGGCRVGAHRSDDSEQ
jgi:hypothetical protein